MKILSTIIINLTIIVKSAFKIQLFDKIEKKLNHKISKPKDQMLQFETLIKILKAIKKSKLK